MNLFSYESKFSQTLMFIGDLCILNFLFVICCIPIFTVGAAQAALYSAMRTLLNPDDDESPVKVFFRGFRTGFGSVTGASLLFLVLEFLMVSTFYGMLSVPGLHTWITILAMVILMLFLAQIPLFHARFTCTAGQLIRNSLLLVVAHPIRSFLVAALTWFPGILFFWDITIFARAIPAWCLLYYSVAFLLSFTFMKKPFQTLIDHYNQTHDQEGNVILATMDEDGNLVYENSIQDALDAEAAKRKEEEEYDE